MGDRTFSEAETPVVEELVVRLDRIPLAIELAATRVRVLPPRTLLSRFGQRFELLSSPGAGRHGSLLQAFTLTWDLLQEREKRVLSRASFFEGGFSYEAAMELLAEGETEAGVLDLLDGLRSKALLQIDSSDPPRFHLFESVRDYATQELQARGLSDEVIRAFSSYFLTHGERHLAQAETKQLLGSLHWIKAERANLLAIHHRGIDSAPALATRAGLILAPVLLLEGHPPSESRLSETTLDAARRSGDPKLLIRALLFRATTLRQHGEIDDALRSAKEALALAREVGARREEGQVLLLVSNLHISRAEAEAARPLLEQAVRIGREEGDPLTEGMALMIQGEEPLSRLLLDEAEALFHRSLEIFRAHGLVRIEAQLLTRLSVVWLSKGRFREARRALRAALTISKQMENPALEITTLGNLGSVELAAGRLDDAEGFLTKALTLQRERGNRLGEALILVNLGLVSLERGHLDPAERRLTNAESVMLDCGARVLHTELLPLLAVVEARRGLLEQARASLAEARTRSEATGNQTHLSRVDLVEGTLEVAEARRIAAADPEGAAALIERARSRLEEAPTLRSANPGNLSSAIRLLEQDLELWAAGLRESGNQAATNGLRIGPDASWFEIAGRPRVMLRRRVAIRRMLDALVERRLCSPGSGLDPQDLFDTGWPGIKLHPESAIKRVYLGIWTLRDLGLSDVVLHQTDGYLLDPSLPVLRQRD